MDKQQSEHIENRFRQAAENFIPPSNNEAWEKMEALLDKKSDKKRVFIWWWPLTLLSLLLAGSAVLYHYVSNSPAEKITVVIAGSKSGTTSDGKSKKEHDLADSGSMLKSQLVNGGKQDPQTQKPFDSGHGSITVTIPAQPAFTGIHSNRGSGKSISQKGQFYRQTGQYTASHGLAGNGKPSVERKKNGTADLFEEYKQETDVSLPVHPIPLLQHSLYVYQINPDDSLLKKSNCSLLLTDSIQQEVNNAAKKEKQKKQSAKPSKFYLIAAAGKSAISLRKFDTKNVGKVYGGEIGYHLSNLWSVQAGLHVGRKIYFAGPADYKFQGAYWPTVTVLKIDANCLIFDIPLSARFDIMNNKNNALYATAGVSSFIMNSEDYKYHFNTSSGAYRKSEMKYKGNTDLFSSANLSVGFEQKLFKTLFVQAEPYAKLPISGIGAGKVKLYSLGIQIGIKYQPLKRK